MFSPHHGDPKQARLMSDLRIMIKAEGQLTCRGDLLMLKQHVPLFASQV